MATRSVAIQYEPTQLTVESLERLHDSGSQTGSVAGVALVVTCINQLLAVEV